MNDRRLEQLLAELAENDALFGTPVARPAALRAGVRIVGLRALIPLAAAAVLLMTFRSPVPAPVTRPVAEEALASLGAPLGISLDHHAGVASANQRHDVVRSCSDEEVYALVLYRGWSHDSRDLIWQLYRFADGTSLARLPAGESIDIPVDVYSAPAVEQTFMLAVARRAGDLPSGPAETEDLLACLNDSLPPSRIEFPGQSADAARACLPQCVTVLPKSIAYSGQ